MKLLLRAIFAALLLAVSTVAAAVTVTLNPDPLLQGQYSASFSVMHTVPNSYADTFDFVSPIDGLLSVTLHSPAFIGAGSNSVGIGFFAYQLSGSLAVNLPSPQADVTIGPFPISAGPHTLTVGVGVFLAPPGTAPAPTTYTGTLSVAALPIPEPETWLLMSVGLLAVAMRRKRWPQLDCACGVP